MAPDYSYLPYKETGYFSRLVTDYLENNAAIKPFFTYAADADGLAAAINDRAKYPVNRKALVSALNRQYGCLSGCDKVHENIGRLLNENTFTVCTAHQPNLLTGYLYFVYKILHAIKLSEELNKQHTDKYFVPVYYMGSEDNDIEELGRFRFRGNKYIWDGDGQQGAVGRMDTAGLKNILNELFNVFGPPGKNCDDLQAMLVQAYLKHKTIAEATQYLVNELFGRYGLVVLDPDDAALKATFIPVMKDELLNQNVHPIVAAQIEKLGSHYKVQAHPRLINLFYLNDQLRERIEKSGDKWIVVNTDIEWTEGTLLEELQQYPERFSPNVVLRPVFQETIMPNVAFIGGGAEVAYWLQLKPLFAHYNVFYPAILLRQSVLWINKAEAELRKQLGIEIKDSFKPTEQLIQDYISAHTNKEWQTEEETKDIENIFKRLKQKATALDPTLEKSAEAALVKMRHQLEVLQTKMLRGEKKKMNVTIKRIEKLKDKLFPKSSLQERVDNFMEYYLEHGNVFFDIIKDGINPSDNRFMIIEKQ